MFLIWRKTNTEPLLQTDDLNQQQAMQKAEEVHQFRQYRARILSIRDIDQEERAKLQDKGLEMYAEMWVSLKMHRSQSTHSFALCKRCQSHIVPGNKEVLKTFSSQLLRKDGKLIIHTNFNYSLKSLYNAVLGISPQSEKNGREDNKMFVKLENSWWRLPEQTWGSQNLSWQ